MLKKLLLLAAMAPALPALAAYDINFPVDATVGSDKGRALNSIGIGEQTAAVGQADDRLLYHDLTETAVFSVTAGEVVTPVVDWSGTWMHAYLYVDLNSDGEFDPSAELISYTYLSYKNSIGANAGLDCGTSLPDFVIPGLKPGDYRMRYVIDWDYADPAGRNTETNNILSNEGAIADATLRVSEAPRAAEAYAVNFPADAQISHTNRRLHAFSVISPLLGAQRIEVGQQSDRQLYHDFTETEITAIPGESISLDYEWTGTWMNSYFYIDRADNGDFSANISSNGTPLPGSDLLGFSNLSGKNSLGMSTDNGNVLSIPAIRIPAELRPGKYRARLKIDWDNADPAGSNGDEENILTYGGAITDFTIVIPEGEVGVANITPMAMNGMLLLADGSPLPEVFATGFDLKVKATAAVPGFATDKIIVRHGPADAPADLEIALDADGCAQIPGSAIDGDIIIYALFEEQEDSEWTKVWGDEFNAEKLDTKRWSYHPRYGATWNRLIAEGSAQQKKVNTFGNGYYNSWCIPTPETFKTETQPMISGAIYSQGKFAFTYGRIEARIKTNPFIGNFPAFWLMPDENTEGGWPLSGEIDIWEQIDTQNRAHATVHSGWTGWRTYCNWTTGPKTASPASSLGHESDASAWHVYALEWDADGLHWFVDGVETFSYKNMHYSEPGTNYTENVCWPFYKNFYVILNQSVGNGSWAKNPDTNHTYLTQFDYVRVYKKKGDDGYKSNLRNNGDDPEFYVPLTGSETPSQPENPEDGIESVEANSAAPVYFDLNGRRVSAPSLPGIYLEQRGAKVTKIIR